MSTWTFLYEFTEFYRVSYRVWGRPCPYIFWPHQLIREKDWTYYSPAKSCSLVLWRPVGRAQSSPSLPSLPSFFSAQGTLHSPSHAIHHGVQHIRHRSLSQVPNSLFHCSAPFLFHCQMISLSFFFGTSRFYSSLAGNRRILCWITASYGPMKRVVVPSRVFRSAGSSQLCIGGSSGGSTLSGSLQQQQKKQNKIPL